MEYFAESAAGFALSSVYDRQGNRKYLTNQERRAFLEASTDFDPEVEAFCLVLAYSGARISEVLSLCDTHIDLDSNAIIINCLKKRRTGVYRAIPMPSRVTERLDSIFALSVRRRAQNLRDPRKLWSWGRTTGWLRVKSVMNKGNIVGPQATPKALRHTLAVTALQSGVPLNLVSRWLGHSRLSTTAIYANAVGEEERSFAKPLWESF